MLRERIRVGYLKKSHGECDEFEVTPLPTAGLPVQIAWVAPEAPRSAMTGPWRAGGNRHL